MNYGYGGARNYGYGSCARYAILIKAVERQGRHRGLYPSRPTYGAFQIAFKTKGETCLRVSPITLNLGGDT